MKPLLCGGVQVANHEKLRVQYLSPRLLSLSNPDKLRTRQGGEGGAALTQLHYRVKTWDKFWRIHGGVLDDLDSEPRHGTDLMVP